MWQEHVWRMGQTSKWFSFHHLAHTSALFISTNSCWNLPSKFSSEKITTVNDMFCDQARGVMELCYQPEYQYQLQFHLGLFLHSFHVLNNPSITIQANKEKVMYQMQA